MEEQRSSENMQKQNATIQKKKNPILEFFKMGEVGGYFFRSKDPSRPSNVNIKMMHGVNKISIAVFLAGVIYLVLKHLL